MDTTLDTVLPWTETLTGEQRAELLRDLALAATDPAVEQREQLVADALATWERFAHDERDREEQYQLYREATRA